jgi:hypothetical protein
MPGAIAEYRRCQMPRSPFFTRPALMRSSFVMRRAHSLSASHAVRYYSAMTIKSFKCKDTERLFKR